MLSVEVNCIIEMCRAAPWLVAPVMMSSLEGTMWVAWLSVESIMIVRVPVIIIGRIKHSRVVVVPSGPVVMSWP